jgi:transcriptional regulator with XRE-family HTH domain
MANEPLPPPEPPRRGRLIHPPLYLRTIRLRRLMTQIELARASGVKQSTISHLERVANVRPAHVTVVALARALRIDADRLRFGPDPEDRRRYHATSDLNHIAS